MNFHKSVEMLTVTLKTDRIGRFGASNAVTET